VIVNGVDANTARIIQGYVRGVWSLWLAGSGASAVRAGVVNPVPRIWFNAAVRSRDFLVPGLIPVIMTLIGTLLTAMIMAREWERGTMEALLATPVGTLEIIAGKTIPYFILGMGGLGISVVLARFLFDVPYRGSYLILALCSTVFMLVALGMGLLISTLARNQFVAGQVAIIATFLPAFILSGFIFDIQSMPEPIQWLTRLVAARYFVAILQTLFLAGMAPGVVWPNLAALLLMAVILFTVVMAKTRKRLD
jgi:ABC-2 type transport system permease protein